MHWYRLPMVLRPEYVAVAREVKEWSLALIVLAVVVWSAFAGEDRLDPDSAAYKSMRNAAFARAGLPTWTQCARGHPSNDCMIVDHIVPLCLQVKGNTLDNIQIQPCAEWTGHRCLAGDASDKDELEDTACADVRAGRTTPEAAAAQFKREWP